MRYQTGYALKDREGEERIRRKFLLLPRSFGEDKEGRWLEYANVRERICKVPEGGTCEFGVYAWRWVEVGFAD